MNKQYLKSFAIIMDEDKPKVNRNFFQKLIDSVSQKLGVKAESPEVKKLYALLNVENFGYRDAISVDEVLEYIPRLKKKTKLSADTNKFFLMRDFDKLVKLLQEFCEEPKRKSKEYEIEITIERPKAKKLRKVTTYDKITILERWVKIGYKMYRRQLDTWTGKEFIVVDGDVYDIKRDRYGNEYLA